MLFHVDHWLKLDRNASIPDNGAMIMKIVIVLLMLAIVASLASAMFYLVRDESTSDNRKVVKALAFRIGLSLFLFILLFVAFAMGWIQPHGIGG